MIASYVSCGKQICQQVCFTIQFILRTMYRNRLFKNVSLLCIQKVVYLTIMLIGLIGIGLDSHTFRNIKENGFSNNLEILVRKGFG